MSVILSALMTADRRYRAVVMDVDGTIVGPDRIIPERLSEAVRQVQRTGAVVSIATGRAQGSALHFANRLGVNGPVICYQGAMTVDPGSGRVMRHARIGADEAETAIETMAGQGAYVSVYVDDVIFIDRSSSWADDYAERMKIVRRTVSSLGDMAASGPTLVLGVLEPDAGRVAAAARAALNGRARVTHSLPHFCEVGSLSAGKETALRHLSHLLGVPSAETIAFGDGTGDAGMLRWAGLGVAMDDGHPEAIAAADKTVEGPPGIGVAVELERLLQQSRIGR